MEKLSHAEIEIEARQLATLAIFWGASRAQDFRILGLLVNYGEHFCTSPIVTTLQALDDTIEALTSWGLHPAREVDMRERLMGFGKQAIRARLASAEQVH